MSVTVKFADRVSPPTMQGTGPKIDTLDDVTIEAGVGVDIDGGWLLVLDKMDEAIAAYCPGSVISATVDPSSVDPTSSDGATPSTSAPAGDGSASTPSTASSGDAVPQVDPVTLQKVDPATTEPDTTEPAAASS